MSHPEALPHSTEAPLRSSILTKDGLHDLGLYLAEHDVSHEERRNSAELRKRFLSNSDLLESAYRTLAEAARCGESLSPGAEWLLDNHHIVQQHIAEIKKFFPRGYDKTLPKLSDGSFRGYPRVYFLALQIITHSDAIVDTDLLSSFVSGFQTRKHLTTGELWAVPIMLKFALVENLRRLIARIIEAREDLLYVDGFLLQHLGASVQDSPHVGTDTLLTLAKELKDRPSLADSGAVHVLRRLRERASRNPLALKWFEERLKEQGADPDGLIRTDHQRQAFDQVSIANSITSLKHLSSINWREWFEAMSFVHRELSRDPSGIYSQCDFLTRDYYRHRIERLSRSLKKAEHVVAAQVVDICNQEPDRTSGRGNEALQHVGFFLVAEGKRRFEKAIGYRPSMFGGIARVAKAGAFPLYMLGLAVLTAGLLLWAASAAHHLGAGWGVVSFLILVLLVPASDVTNSLIQWLVHQFSTPSLLPKLSLESGVPQESRTLVVVHGIFDEELSLERCVEGLEVRFYANEDQQIFFAIMADLPDRTVLDEARDANIVAAGKRLIRDLNLRHGYTDDAPRFFIFFRERRWNESEGRFMAWERKRGKVDELNREILGHTGTTLQLTDAERAFLQTVRYVITLDGDSHLTPGGAKKLVGTISHPLNRAVFSEATRMVTRGYGIIQPRVSYSLPSGFASRFARIYSWDLGLDPYTQTISDFYQDVFAEGSFLGKGIYDVRAFEHALEGRVPENALLSHDLFEGLFARVGLATDIEVYDEVPSRYHVHAKRQHRWVRGDWQLLPWLRRYVPDAKREPYRNPISSLGKWKLFDNLRRSLVAPSLFALLVLSWTVLPGSPFWWFVAVLPVVLFPIYTNIAAAIMSPPLGLSLGVYLKSLARDVFQHAAQGALFFLFLPHQSYLMVHAIVLTLYRLAISKTHLLEWETAASSERRLGSSFLSFVRVMRPALWITASLAPLLYVVAPNRLEFAVPFLVVWMSGPIVATLLGGKPSEPSLRLQEQQRHYLLALGYQTWEYFKDHLIQKYNYLIPDNLQLSPQRVVASRTSPTNISLSMLSAVSAYELGYEPSRSVVSLLGKIFESLSRLERYNGHLLNWYDVETLKPLAPRYVSSVDSGNFVGHLVAVRTHAHALWSAPLCRPAFVPHLIARLTAISTTGRLGKTVIDDCCSKLRACGAVPEMRIPVLVQAIKGVCDVLEQASDSERMSIFQEVEELQTFCEQIDVLIWYYPLADLAASADCPKAVVTLWESVRSAEASPLRIADILNTIDGIRDSGSLSSDSLARLSFVEAAARKARGPLEEMQFGLQAVFDRCSDWIDEVDFKFLFDGSKALFPVGYNVDTARKDGSYYDLLASEARLTSLIAIAKGDVPLKHWFSLGRTLADTPGGKALVSWSGTMFEYLMPLVVLKSFPETLLGRSYRAVIDTQKLYAHRRSVPWGISESAYSGVDFNSTYQYRAFGVPGLGLKRGLENDLVISPYSTCLALMVEPVSAVHNLQRMESIGLRGEYGFYEAADYTEDRLAPGESTHIVKSFFAHHQGMSIPSIANVLCKGVIQELFHADPLIRAVELLLHEKFPSRIPLTEPRQSPLSYAEQQAQKETTRKERVFSSPHTVIPATHILSNGHLTSLNDNSGSGFLSFDRDIAVTRWREDLIGNLYGLYIYIRDLDSQQLWSATYNPTRVEPEIYEVIFKGDKVEYVRRDNGILLALEITVAQEENVEVRRLTLSNLSSRERNIEITTYGEVALGGARNDVAHPAFAKMFIESRFDADSDAVVLSRRPRSVNEGELHLFHLITLKSCYDRTQCETSRASFIGRGRTAIDPVALKQARLGNSVGNVLDPIISLRTRVVLTSGQSESVSFVTGVARSQDECRRLIGKYNDLHSISRAFELSWSQSSVELRNEQFTARQTHSFQALGSALMFPVEWLRASNEVLAKNNLTQSGLWRFGISGDVPIILVRLQDGGQLRLARELILAHYYLRVRGIVADLVFLNEFPGGYFQQLQEELLGLVRTSPDSGMLDRPGGIFLRTSQQISPEENILLQSVARVVFNGAAGSLEEQLDVDRLYAVKKPPVPGMLVSMREMDDVTSAYDGRAWECGSDVGGFVEQGRRFQLLVKRDALPPLPWSNVIANPTFGTLITETGGGYTWSQNSRENRISPWSNDPVSDPISEAIFLRDTENGHYWSPTPRPVVRDTVTRVTHSAGETTFETKHLGIASTLSILVSSDEAVKWWNVTLQNTDLVSRRLEAYLYVDLVMGVFQGEASRYIQSEYDAGSQTLHWVNRYNNEFAGRYVGIGSSLSIVSYTSDKVEFIGRNRSLAMPIALDTAGALRVTNFHTARRNLVRLSQRVGGGYPPCGVLKVLVNLEPGETRNFQFFLHEATSLEALRSNAVRYKKLDSLSEDKERTEQSWRRLLSGVSVKTPERSFDILVNYWLLYQTVSCRLFARTGFYQSGGAFGFRDQLQDVMALLLSRPDLVRSQILLHASRQFVEGDVQHWWHPPTGRGVRTKISDDLVWLPYCVARYCEATGDYAILDEDIQYLESAPLGEAHESYIIPSVSGQRGSLYDHCLRALDRAMRLGERGLPLMGGGDWNDGMNEVGVHGKGESVWLGWFIIHTLRLFGPLVEMRDPSRATRYQEQADDLVKAIEATSWDGEWYRRAYCDDGAPLGSSSNDECQIDSIAQTWSVITGEGDPIRARQAMDAVDQRLVADQARIIKLLTPPFSNGSLRPGFIKGYLPGIRENGGQYTHASTWVVLANALMKRGSRAFELFQMLNPITHTNSNSKVSVYQGEPYALCGDVYGVEPHVGRAGWSWYTGSAGWLYQIAIHHLLGISINQDILTINPCIPGAWDGYEVVLTIGVPIRLKISNPHHVESGVNAITINGSSVPVGPINLKGRAEELLIEVVMG